MINKIYIDWEDFGLAVDELVKVIKKSQKNYDGVYGLPRGGLTIAVALSHKLGLPMKYRPTKDTLIVDDINDTGKTLKPHSKNDIAVIYSTMWSIVEPTFFTKYKTRKDSWIIFPWEDYDIEESKDMEVIKK